MLLKRVLSASVLLAAIPALAQGGPGGPMEHGPMGRGFGGMGFGGMRTPVTNEPYSATFTSTSTEKLQDGTILNHSTTRLASRDSLGRTREEVTMPAHGTDATPHTMIVILDPVAHTVTQLRTTEKIAVVHAIPQPGPGGAGRRGPGGPPSAGASTDSTTTAPTYERHKDKNVVETDLGSKTIDGVIATGKRITRTIPAGEMGNAAPVISTHEEWFSPDLKIELSRNDVDPFHGTRTTAATTLTKAEPDASLFKVPEGYTVQQATEHASGRRGPGGPHHDGGSPPPGM